MPTNHCNTMTIRSIFSAVAFFIDFLFHPMGTEMTDDSPQKKDPLPQPCKPELIPRKGIVLRLSKHIQEPPPADALSQFFEPGGPRVAFVVALDDEQGNEVVTVDQMWSGTTALVGEGDRVIVTYWNRRYGAYPASEAYVSLDLEYLKRTL